MSEQAKTVLIGVFIIIACLATIGILLFLRPSVGDAGKRLYVCFTSIEKIQIGTRVTFAGKPVGEVVAIKEIYDARSQPTDRSGHVCFYELELAIDSHTVIYDTDEIVIHTTGLLGEKTIAIIPKAVKKGQPSYPVTDQVLYGKSGDAVDEIINQLANVSTKANEMMESITRVIKKNETEFHSMITNISGAAESFKTNLDQATEVNLVGSLKNSADNVSIFFQKLDTKNVADNLSITTQNLADITTAVNDKDMLKETMDNLRIFSGELASLKGRLAHTLRLIDETMPDVKTTFRNASEITTSINNSTTHGVGTFGKLIKNDDLYVRFNTLMGKVDILLNDVNNYGMLFHQNKGWQRERLKRIARLNNLCTSEDFKRYFDEEIAKINVSLGHVAMSIQKAKIKQGPCNLSLDQKFNWDFIQLLDRVNDLQETLKLYQQELIKCK